MLKRLFRGFGMLLMGEAMFYAIFGVIALLVYFIGNIL